MKQQGILLLEVLLALVLFSAVCLACLKQQWVTAYRLNEFTHQCQAFELLSKAQLWYWQGHHELSFLTERSLLPDANLTLLMQHDDIAAITLYWQEPRESDLKALHCMAY